MISLKFNRLLIILDIPMIPGTFTANTKTIIFWNLIIVVLSIDLKSKINQISIFGIRSTSYNKANFVLFFTFI